MTAPEHNLLSSFYIYTNIVIICFRFVRYVVRRGLICNEHYHYQKYKDCVHYYRSPCFKAMFGDRREHGKMYEFNFRVKHSLQPA